MLNHWRFAILTVTFIMTLVLGRVAHAQLPHLPTVPVDVSGQTSAAAMAQHHALMLKMFDLNGDGILEPNEIALAKSGLGKFLEQAANGTLGTGQPMPAGGGANGGKAAAVAGHQNLLTFFDRNGNGQLDLVELRLAQMTMAMLAGGNAMRPATGFVPVMPPDEDPNFQTSPAPPSRKSRRKRAERVADFGKAKNMAPAKQAAPRAKKVKARAPMVEQQQPQVRKPAALNGGANE